MPTQPKMLTLSAEVLGLVLNAGLTDSPADLVRLATTCKHMSKIVLPLLLRHVRVVANSGGAVNVSKMSSLAGLARRYVNAQYIRTLDISDPHSYLDPIHSGTLLEGAVLGLPVLTSVDIPAHMLSPKMLGLLHAKISVVDLGITDFCCQPLPRCPLPFDAGDVGPLPDPRPGGSSPLVLRGLAVAVPTTERPVNIIRAHHLLALLSCYHMHLPSFALRYLSNMPSHGNQAKKMKRRGPLAFQEPRPLNDYFADLERVTLEVTERSIFLGLVWLAAVTYLRRHLHRVTIVVMASEQSFSYLGLPGLPSWERPSWQLGGEPIDGTTASEFSWRRLELEKCLADFDRNDGGPMKPYKIVSLTLILSSNTTIVPAHLDSLLSDHPEMARSLRSLTLKGGRWDQDGWNTMETWAIDRALPYLRLFAVEGHVDLVEGVEGASIVRSLSRSFSKLGCLPADIVGRIIDLGLVPDVTSIAALASTCKHLSQAVQPFLDRDLRLVANASSPTNERRLIQLLRFVCEADRGRRVRSLKVVDRDSYLLPLSGYALALLIRRLPSLTSVSLAAGMLTTETLPLLHKKLSVVRLAITSYHGQRLFHCALPPREPFSLPPRPAGSPPLVLCDFVVSVRADDDPNKVAKIHKLMEYLASHFLICPEMTLEFYPATNNQLSQPRRAAISGDLKHRGPLTWQMDKPYFPELRPVSLVVTELSITLGYLWLGAVPARRPTVDRLIISVVPSVGPSFNLDGRPGIPLWKGGKLYLETQQANQSPWRAVRLSTLRAEYSSEDGDVDAPWKLDSLAVTFGPNTIVGPDQVAGLLNERRSTKRSLRRLVLDGGSWDNKAWLASNVDVFLGASLTKLDSLSVNGIELHADALVAGPGLDSRPSFMATLQDRLRALAPPVHA